VNACVDCAKRKPSQPKTNGFLEPKVPNGPFETISIDIVGPFKIYRMEIDTYWFVLIFKDL
jgi:hypothetical protein